MLLHVSMPADDCRSVAQTLAELMNGSAFRFPPGGPQAWNVWSADASTQIVVTPRGQCMIAGEREVAWTSRPIERAVESHFALAVPRPAAELLAIAARVDWPARICERGTFFPVVELWVEGAYLVELLDPTFAQAYRRSMTLANWQAAFSA